MAILRVKDENGNVIDIPAIVGKDGEQGPKGDKGDTGAQGPKGDTGATGAVGKSAYQYAKDGGYTGTEAEFAAKLAEEIPTVPTKVSAFTNDANYAKKSELPTVPTKVSAFENDKGYITAEDIPAASQSDFAQNDPTAADYVKNRTHYESWAEFLPETTAEYDEGMGCAIYEGETSKSLEVGKQYKLVVNGIENNITAISADGAPALLMDDGSLFGTMDMGDGFYMIVGFFMATEDVTFKVEELNVVTLPERFLPASARCYNLVLSKEEWGDTELVELERSCDDFIQLLWNGGTVNIIRISENSRSNSQVISWAYQFTEGSGTLALVTSDKRVLMYGTWVPPTE